MESLDRRAAEISAHREAQRTQPPSPVNQGDIAGTATKALEKAPTPHMAAPYWTDFRGPQRDGHYREQPIQVDWPATGMRPLWKQPVGGGHASFVIAEGRAFTIEQRGREELVAAYDVRTGRELWTNAWPALFSEVYGGIGPRATPTWKDRTVFALGATGELRALDATTGRVRWRRNILDDAGASNLEWGMAGSPLVVGDTVVV